jgi:hypothetical protein
MICFETNKVSDVAAAGFTALSEPSMSIRSFGHQAGFVRTDGHLEVRGRFVPERIWSMNARVFLLMLVTAIFMGVWSSDTAAMQKAMAAQQQRLQKQIETVAPHEASFRLFNAIPVSLMLLQDEDGDQPSRTSEQSGKPLTAIAGMAHAKSLSPDEQRLLEQLPAIQEEDHYIPFPTHLAEGAWQVIGAEGRSMRITVDRSAAEKQRLSAQKSLEESFCIQTSKDGSRWCFIRSWKLQPESERASRVSTEFFSPMPR